MKGSGGCIGLTENPIAFKRWMLSGPELARLQNQFETEYLPAIDLDDPKYFQNHQSGYAAQKSFHKQVNSLYSAISNLENPFLDDFPELVTLDSRNCTCMDELAVNSLHTLEDIGTKRDQGFVKCVMEECSISIHDPIKKNSLTIFKPPQARVTSKQGNKSRYCKTM